MIFDALDEEKDGEIELDEFLVQMKEKFQIIISRDEMTKIVRQVDLDYDGKI
jgi:Ca2+-binding EF-hand superfamily protein